MKPVRWILAPLGFVAAVIVVHGIANWISINLSNDLLAVKYRPNPYGGNTVFIATFIGSIAALLILPNFRIPAAGALTVMLIIFAVIKSSPTAILNETGMKSSNGTWAMASWPTGAAIAGILIGIREKRRQSGANKGLVRTGDPRTARQSAQP